MRSRPSRSPILDGASDHRAGERPAPSFATLDLTRSSDRSGEETREKAPRQTSLRRTEKLRLPSSRWHSRQGRRSLARAIASVPSPEASTTGPLAFRPSGGSARPPPALLPFKGPLLDNVKIPDQQDADENQHLDETEESQLSKGD